MSNYISKEKDKYLQAMKQTFKETLEKKKRKIISNK